MSTRETMTSRERVLKAINHEIPDRVPIDLGGFQSGIHKSTYQALLDHLGLRDTITIQSQVQGLAKVGEDVLRRFRVDTRYITARRPDGYDGSVKVNMRDGRKWHDFTDEFGAVWSMPDDFPLYSDVSLHPLAEADLAGLDRHPWPNGSDPTRFVGLREQAMQIRKETPYALCTGIAGVMYEYCWYLRGLEQWYVDLLENPAFCEKLLDKMLGFWKDFFTGYMAEIGDLVDVIMIGDDLAGQRGPLFNPEIYRGLVKPRHKALVQHIKSKTKAKIWYHTCGSCTTYIPELADNGVDILNPIQIGIEGMEPHELKEKYGQQMVFWGGAVDAQHVLPHQKPEVIREHVGRNMETFKPGGGYVFANVHNIQAGVPAENVVALFDAGYEFGVYGQ